MKLDRYVDQALLMLVVMVGGRATATEPAQVPTPPATSPASASAPQASGSAELTPEQGFARWIEAFKPSARSAGIDEATLSAAFDAVRYQPRVVELDRVQPEFTRTVWDYLDRGVSPQRIALGQEKLAQVRAQADAAAARYGVPATILVAIWGMESNFGGNFGDVPTVDALATLGFDGRRQDWARTELVAALKILKSGDIDRRRMIGSWAGAMGHTQLLPSNFLAYAVDADGDNRRDIWGSMADVLASTANMLARAGWRADQPWGAEVWLQAGFDPARADPAVRMSSADWAAEGVLSQRGAPLPSMTDASILLPAGGRGPAFLVGPNFRALLRYNNATSYALAVGLLAQQLAGGPGVQAAWPREWPAITRTQVQAMQEALNRQGYASGAADGLMGPATRDAIRRYQRGVGLPADGYPDPELLQRLVPTPP